MTDTLKTLKADADQKKLVAENLRTQTRKAYATAARAQAVYIAEEKRLKALSAGKPTDSVQEATTEEVTHLHSNPVSSSEDYHKDKIAQSEAIITNLEHELSEERDKLDVYKQNLRECQSRDDLSSIVERDRRAEYWLEQLQTKYRHYHSAEVAMILDKAGFQSIDLCYLVVDMAGIIKSETVENLKVIDIMKNRDGLLTTPGNVKDSIYYHICKSQGIDLSTKSVKERPAVIREALGRWGVDDAFRESNRIMRHWAQHGHQQKKEAASVDRMPKNKKELKEWIQCERRKRKSEKPGYFIAWLEQQPQFTEFAGKKPANQTLYSWIRVQ